MKIRRRDFIKGVAGSALLSACASSGEALARNNGRSPEALGMLYDATLCIGCQACMVGCKRANNMPYEYTGDQRIWDNPLNLSAKTLNVIKKYEFTDDGEKDTAEGYSFIKRHCMHCAEPSCVSACPVSAMTKEPGTGIVRYNKELCIGCRYCQVACPFNIPKFEWESPTPEIVKCQLCSHLVAKGGIAACCASCPTGASIFGPVELLYREARRRQNMSPGKYYEFPVAAISGPSSGRVTRQKAAQYIPEIYGEDEVGGTQIMYLSGVSFDKLGLPDLPDKSYAALSDGIQYAIYKGMVYPLVVLLGLIYLVRKDEKEE